jgi:hypothetical protein
MSWRLQGLVAGPSRDETKSLTKASNPTLRNILESLNKFKKLLVYESDLET